MGKIILKMKHSFEKKDRQKTGDKFIEIMEVIYAIILACGVVKIVDILEKDFASVPCDTWFAIGIAILVLIRFFFAPSKNVMILIKEAKWRLLIMPFDVSILIVHSFIYYYICINVMKTAIFYRCFFILLLVNAIWLFTIWGRLKNKSQFKYIRFWAWNNLICFTLYLIFYFLRPELWLPWFVLAFLNSGFDLVKTYPEYMKD